MADRSLPPLVQRMRHHTTPNASKGDCLASTPSGRASPNDPRYRASAAWYSPDRSGASHMTLAHAKKRWTHSSYKPHISIREQLRTGRTYHDRSEEHTSELQSQSNLVCRLLLEKK